MSEQDIRNRRKVLIFSYYADTVDWIYEHLAETVPNDARLSAYRDRIASLSGNTGTNSKEAVIWGFAPKTSDAPEGRDDDLYDIVVDHRCAGRGGEPAAGPSHHQLRPAVEPHAAGAAPRPHRPHRLASLRGVHSLRVPRHPPRRTAEPGGATAPKDQAGRSQYRRRRGSSRPTRPGSHLHRDPRGDRAHPPRGGRPVRAGRNRPRRVVR